MRISLVAFAVFVLFAAASAQETNGTYSPSRDLYATRPELLSHLGAAEANAQQATDSRERERYLAVAQSIRERLDKGDLRVGDRIFIEAVNPALAAVSETLTVRNGQVLQLRGMEDEVPMRGVLRSELDVHLTKALSERWRDPVIRTTVLLGIYITGQVVAPGARNVREDATIRDVVTGTGTITPQANLNKIVVRRHGEVIHDGKTMTRAREEGLTVGDMQLLSGDEIEVGLKRSPNWYTIVQVASGTLGLLIGIYNLAR